MTGTGGSREVGDRAVTQGRRSQSGEEEEGSGNLLTIAEAGGGA